jgi:hypothetical protein
MADTTTKKILIEVEAKYAQITRAIAEMSNLAVQIDSLKTLRKIEQTETGKTSQAYIALDTQLKSTQKEYNTLNRFVVAANVSAKAMESTLAEGGTFILSQEAQLGKLTMAWKGLTTTQQASTQGQALKAQIDAVTKSLYENGTQLDKNRLTVGNYAGAIEGLIVKMSKEGQAVGATSQAYSALLAKYQMAEAEARQLILTKGADDVQTMESIARMKQYGMEIDKLNTTMGKYSAKTVNAQYATFSLSQVVREMPNFAIDARLGFMALSNNLPMLAQDFQTLKTQLGSTSKALAAFGKSLLGVNTIMVLLSTVLIAWGPQMLAWAKSLFAGAEATDVQTQKLKALDEVLKKGDSGLKTAIAGQIKLGVVLDKAKDGVISGDAAVREYNKTLGEHYGKVKTLSEAVAGYGRYSQEFIKAKIAEAAAMKLTDETADEVLKAERARQALRGLGAKELGALNEEFKKVKAVATSSKQLGDALSYVSKVGGIGGIYSKMPKGSAATVDALLRLSKLKGGWAFIDEMARLKEANTNIARTTKTIESLYSVLNDDFTKPDPTETPAQKLKRLSEEAISEAQIRNEAAEAAIKAEEGYQSEDFSKKQAYERRLFDLKQQFEAEKFGILVKYQQKTKTQQQAFIAAQRNDAATFEKNQSDKADKNAKEQLEKQQKAAKDARNALLKLLGDNEQAEIQLIKETYAEKIKAYEDSLGDITKLDGEQLYDMLALELAVEEQKQKDILKIKEKYRKAAEEASRAGIIKQFADETLAAKQSIEEKYKAEKNRIDAELALLDGKYSTTAKMDEKDAARYRKLLEDRTANDKAYEENKLAVKEWFQDKAAEILSAINDVSNAFAEREKDRIQTTHDEDVAALDDRLSRGLISQKKHDAEVKRLDESLDKEKARIAKRQAIRERLMSIISIGMDTAKAIMGIWADFPKIDFGVSAGTATGIVSALGAAQVAAVLAQPLPKASRGLLLRGPSHAAGGIPIEAEGGEAIINKRSTSMFKPLLSAINAAGGGVRFAAGGIPVGLANDGGFSARQAFPVSIGPTAKEIAEAISEMNISVSVEQIEKATAKFVKVRGRATY